MASVKCFKCGTVNINGNISCESCGEKLFRGQEYEERFQELKDYVEFQKRYGILGNYPCNCCAVIIVSSS